MTPIRLFSTYLGALALISCCYGPIAMATEAVDKVKSVECKPKDKNQKGDLPCTYTCPAGKTCTMKLVVRTNGTPPVIETPITVQAGQEYTITESAANSGLLAHSCTHPD